MTVKTVSNRPAAALSYRDFRLFQLSRFASTIAVQILSVAVGFQVYDVTRRPLALGYVVSTLMDVFSAKPDSLLPGRPN